MTQHEPERRHRLYSAVALLALAAALLVLAGGTIRRLDVLLAAVLALAVLVSAAWIALTRRGPRRLIAGAVCVAALVVLVVVLVSSQSIPVLVATVALAALSVGAARRALDQPTTGTASSTTAAPRAEKPVLLMNLKSGGGKAERFELVRECRERGIEPVVLTPGSDLLQLAEEAVAGGADVIGMAGGDGSQALVASVASAHGVPFVVVPAGTRNHLALDLGLDRDDVVGALDAFTDGVQRVVDLAEVNGRVFVNNASMGVYAEIVQSDAYRDAKIQTTTDMLPDLLGPDAKTLDLRFTRPDGREASTASLVLVSNNPYQLSGLRGAFTRARMDTGRLGVVSLVLSGLPEVQQLAALQAIGQSRRFQGLDEWTTTDFEVHSEAPVEIGVDGEALTMAAPLRFRIRPRALTVQLPRATAAGRSAPSPVRISSRDTIAALWRTAWGRSTS